ncbi:tetratricopeptide repeat protein [Entomospira culicis]|uniref:Tetratricopeptide repeat protein n=1 Tax=Entomospira culicis TaxID=2719989 RepID=A0A968GJQ6_9SPIO|nr:tetratricopeptide repeat protein [Entomospira culicis]NIZ18900.1 tetratricopeptide repeat protein [Entomospira culicis]NIZ69115.1 tetratricopeptide repeat protein [Entomospira culicis]WDI37701.1 tetratricopeptide repeat protein [Entomospira culicis]WDI39329.1 tetratricopeptide repeat protein [Entomospira culicis]
MKYVIILTLFILTLTSALSAQTMDRLSRDALLALREERYEEAISLAQRVQDGLDPENSSGYFEITLTKIRALIPLSRYQEALNEAQQLLRIDSKDARLIQILGEIYYHLGRGSDALPYLMDYVAYNPTGEAIGQTYYYMGEIYLLRGSYQQAEMALSTAVYHNPQSDKWWSRLGYAREQAATLLVGSERIYMLNSAKNAYERVLQLNPSNNEAKSRIAVLQRSLR